jgi:hypothetical protein
MAKLNVSNLEFQMRLNEIVTAFHDLARAIEAPKCESPEMVKLANILRSLADLTADLKTAIHEDQILFGALNNTQLSSIFAICDRYLSNFTQINNFR